MFTPLRDSEIDKDHMATVAEYIINVLSSIDVKRIYGIAGDSLNAFTDAIRTKEHFNWISMRHEEAAAFAAGAEAQISQSLAVCAGSCGPGNLHLINGLYDCHRSNAPVLAIAAQIPTSEIGSDYFQETHPERIFLECSHFCEIVSSPEQVPRLLSIAIQKAISLKGVSILIIPGNTAWKKIPESPTEFFFPQTLRTAQTSSHLEDVVQVLNKSKKITLFGGIGCQGAHDELLALADCLKAPIVHTLRGKECIEYNNPFDVGLTGLLGFSSGYEALMNCDTLLLLGTDFPYRQFYPNHATIIQVDQKAENIGRRTNVDYAIIGDVKITMAELLKKLTKKEDDRFLKTSLASYKKARENLNDLAIESPEGRPIHPQFLAKLINDHAKEDAIFLCDVGTPTIWASRYLTMNGKRKLLGSFKHGSMANALPQAIGAQLECPDKQVIALSGDGGIAMLMGDLLTLKQYQLPVKVIIFNNSSYGFVELEMKASGVLEYGTELHNPDFAKIAEAIGILGLKVEQSKDLPQAIQKALSHQGPVILDVIVDRNELAMPPVITLDEAKGFGLYLIQAVINGKGDQIIELVRSNVTNK